jgi:hypothetical protein
MSRKSKRRHIDCSWLIGNEDTGYRCCDIRGAVNGKKLSKEDAKKEACEYFHSQNKKEARVKKEEAL